MDIDINSIHNRNHFFLLLLLPFLISLQLWPSQVLAGARARNGEITKGKAVSFSDCRTLTVLEDGAYWPVLKDAVDKAQKEIYLSFFTFKTKGKGGGCPDLILASLAGAAKRGVKVVVLLERGRVPDEQLNRENLETGKRLQKKGAHVYLDAPSTTTHTKMAVVDGEHTFIGSHNLTQSALKYNHEISVLIKSPQVAAEARGYINSIITTEGEPLIKKD